MILKSLRTSGIGCSQRLMNSVNCKYFDCHIPQYFEQFIPIFNYSSAHFFTDLAFRSVMLI